MRARTLLGVVSLGLLSACFGLALVLRGVEEGGSAPRAVVPDPAPQARAPRTAAAQEAAREVDAGAVDGGSNPSAAGRRALGWMPLETDTLHALSGSVLDAESERPVAGMRLSLLSARPRTCAVVTDSNGRFETGAELAAGVISVLHTPDESELRFQARWEIEPSQFLLTGRERARPELVLRAKSPECVLAVDVLLPGGAPAGGSAVALTAGRRDAHGRFLSESRDYEVADADGRARFALFGADIMERTFEIEAEHGGALASDVLVLDPPLSARPQRLELHPGAVVHVRARNDEGRPVAGVSLRLSAGAGSSSEQTRHGTTDALGTCRFGALRAGCWTIDAVHPLTGASQVKEVDLARGAEESADFQLSLAHLRLGVSGTVVDELGYPLPETSIRIQAPGESPLELSTGEGGRFEFWSRACSGLLLSAGAGFLDDEFEPELAAIEFGTTGVEIRRRRKLESHSLPFLAIDRESGAPVRRARITLFHGARGAEPGSPAQQSFQAAAGVVQVVFKLHAESSWAVDAPGYKRASGSLVELCETFRDHGTLRVELERGFERRVVVRDRVTRRALAGAALVEGARLAGTTAASGAVELRSSEWPLALRVECTGYEPELWDPLAAPYPGETIWLEPLRSR